MMSLHGDWIERGEDQETVIDYVALLLDQIARTEQELGKSFKTLTIRIGKDEPFFSEKALPGPFAAWKGETE